MTFIKFTYPYYFVDSGKVATTTTRSKWDDIARLQREIVQKVIRTNSRSKLYRILELVKETLDQK